MATCKDCIHYKACKSLLESLGYTVNGPGEDADKRCETFADKYRYLKIPVSIGDTVYVLMMGRVLPFDVLSVNYYNEDPTIKALHGLHLVWVFGEDAIGKTVFLTKSEAEAALKEEDNGC